MDPALTSVISQSLSVIPCRCGNDSLIALFPGQSEQLVERAALFECASPLQIVELQVDRVAGELRKRRGDGARRKVDRLANPVQSGFDVGEIDLLRAL